ncbi:YqaA family protein [Pontixanthobacter sp.]|uniref:YqaA family protein n=1 Tax=Pontixanthobacter sp. TaxID=2792078 RepID=UPI003C7EBF9D
MTAYLTLFFTALIAATILPLGSEAVLAALLITGDHSAAMLIMAATAGNVLGSVINWYLGRHLLRYKNARWFPSSGEQLARAQRWYSRYGRWSLLASWVPIIGDPLTMIAGVMRAPLPSFLVLVTAAKAGRYLALAAVSLAWF